MDGQRLLARSFEQLVISSHGLSRARSSSRLTKINRMRQTPSIPSRSFASTRLLRDEPSKAAPEAKQNESQPKPAPEPRKLSMNETLSKLMEGPTGLGTRKPNRQQPSWRTRAALNYEQYGEKSNLFSRARVPTKTSSILNTPDFSIINDLIPGTQERDKVEPRKEKKLRLKPSLGRTVAINHDANMDLTRAFVTLESRINSRGNAVRRDARKQLTHVRRGQAKKMKKRERWRIQFKAGFLAECERVRKMLKQGW